jgi:integrase
VEAITRAAAGRFIHERYVEPQVDAKTANKDISCLNSYWKWMRKREGVKDNPWSEQRLDEANRSREATETSDDKRPFTDDEVRKLLTGIRLRREWEFSLFAALSGLRVHEIAGLRIKDCADNKITVTKSKTPSGVRTIPAHSLLRPLIAQLSKGKNPTDYLFDELAEQRTGSKRDRSAPVSQSFTRERRRLGVEEKATDKQRQSNVDFHSWRRWFVRKAVEALEKGGAGFTPWTIAHVIGHKVEDGTIEGQPLPLGMTMGVYAGASSWEAMVACVKAVALPKGATARRADLAMKPDTRPIIKRKLRGNSGTSRVD